MTVPGRDLPTRAAAAGCRLGLGCPRRPTRSRAALWCAAAPWPGPPEAILTQVEPGLLVIPGPSRPRRAGSLCGRGREPGGVTAWEGSGRMAAPCRSTGLPKVAAARPQDQAEGGVQCGLPDQGLHERGCEEKVSGRNLRCRRCSRPQPKVQPRPCKGNKLTSTRGGHCLPPGPCGGYCVPLLDSG